MLFFTVNIAERNRSLLIDHVDNLPAGIKKVQQKHPFFVNAIVILPDHLHTLWILPLEDNDSARNIDYIHFNLVKHSYVERTVVW